MAAGVLVFLSAEVDGLSLFPMFLISTFALLMVAFATLSLPLFWWALQTEKKLLSRVVAAGQVVSILLAWFWVQMPVVIRLAEPAPDLTFYNSVAPDATLRQLFLALVVGSCIILPSLYYLVKVFKGERFSSEK